MKARSSEQLPHYVSAAGRDLVTAGIGVLIVVSVFVDGWAHFNRPSLETFFTPWHAALYASLGVMTSWLGFLAWHGASGDWRKLRSSLPTGYGLTVTGVGIFALGGASDLLWHELFGIEIAIDALISPTHLILGAGGLLIVSTGMRSQGVLGRGDATARWSAAALLSMALTIGIVTFFLVYTSAFAATQPVETFTPTAEGTPGHEAAELPVVAALASYLLTTVVFTLPVLLMRGIQPRPPRGAAALVVGTVAWLSVFIVDFPPTAVAGAIGATLGALLFDLTVTMFPARIGAGALGAALASLVWSGQLAGVAVSESLRWPVSLWTGAVVLTALMGAAIGLLSDNRAPLGPARDVR